MPADVIPLPINLPELTGRIPDSAVTFARAEFIDLWTALEYRMIRVGSSRCPLYTSVNVECSPQELDYVT